MLLLRDCLTTVDRLILVGLTSVHLVLIGLILIADGLVGMCRLG